MSEFKNLLMNFILAMLLVISLFSLSIISQEQNDAADPLRNDQIFNESFTGLINIVDNNTDQAESKYSAFNSEEPKSGFSSINLISIVSVGKTFSSIAFGTFTAIINLPLRVLGIPRTVYNQILTLLIISVIVAVWLFYKLGG